MPSKPIPFGNDQQSAFDELSGASPSSINVVTDAKGVVRRRPGIATYSEAPAVVDAGGNEISSVYVTAGGVLYAVAEGALERPIYRVGAGSAVKLGGGLAHRGVLGTGRPVVAETEMLLVLAGGEQMEKLVLSTGATSRLGGVGQPTASHVIANASRLLANQLDTYRSRVHWSDIATGDITYAGHEVWSYGVGTAGFFTQEARPDPVVALGENTNEVWVWGSQTLQVWAPDPGATYAPVAVIEHGCAAAHSVIKIDGQFAWLDDRRRFVLSNGRSLDPISAPIQWQLNAIVDPSDCYGYRVITGRSEVMVWSFPSDGRTFAFQKGSGWGQWQGRSAGAWRAFGVTAHHLRRDTNVNVVGTPDGIVAKLDDTAGDDLGTAIVASVTTGFIDRETDNRKHCQGIRVVMRRDYHLGADGKLLVSWRDGPGDPWEPPLEVSLGSEADPVVEFNSLGVYRHRQWRFRFSGSGVFTLAGVSERYEVQEDS